MSESTQEQTPKQVISLKDFLAKPKHERPKVLLEKEVSLETETVKLTLIVRQLTKAQYETFNKRIQGESPQVPLVDVLYTQAHRDPSNPQKIRPAGNYKERDEKDPAYQKEVQEWFTSSCIMLAIFAAAESLGVSADDIEAINDTYLRVSEEISGPGLLEFAIGAAEVNPGIGIAEELRKQEMLRQQAVLAEIALAEAEAEEARLQEAEERAAYDEAQRGLVPEPPPAPAPPVTGVEAKEMILSTMPGNQDAPDEA